jgi:hypothetical protein
MRVKQNLRAHKQNVSNGVWISSFDTDGARIKHNEPLF